MAHSPFPKQIAGPTGGGDEKRITYTQVDGTEIVYMVADAASKRLATNFDRLPVQHAITAPKGSKALFVQNRRCGDWYAEFEADKRVVAAIGPTCVEAVENAARKLAA